MIYIIDANNLAGKMGMLGKENFSEELSAIIKSYKPEKNHLYFLVFDSNEMMGDQYRLNDKVSLIFAPRDGYYKDADDKIVELAEKFAPLKSEHGKVVIVSDDLEIKEKVDNLNKEKNLSLKFESTSDFYQKLKFYFQKSIDKDDELSEDEEDEINKEFMNFWK
jgi:hypothetical protein